MNQRTIATLELVATMLLVSLVTVLAKASLIQVKAMDFIALQLLFAILAMGFYTFVLRKEKLPFNAPLNAWLLVILLGLLNFTIVRSLFILALDIIPANTHAYLINFVGIVTLVLSAVLLREPANKIQILGALTAVAGTQLYFGFGAIVFDGRGVFMILTAVLFLALTNIVMRLLHTRFSGVISANLIAFVALLSGGLPVLSYWFIYWQGLPEVNWSDWFVIAANGIVAMAMTMVVFNRAMRFLKAYEASILASTGLVFTVFFSQLILAESIGLTQLGGIGLLLLGIISVQLGAYKR